MPSESRRMAALAAEARRRGATRARIIPAESIVVDERVHLKCLAPLCDNYGRHLLCPPNVMAIGELREAIRRYKHALLLQIEADYDSQDKSTKHLDGHLTAHLEKVTGARDFEKKLAQLVEDMEASAFKAGFYLSSGLGGSECILCKVCVGQGVGKLCRHPFRARPSMQALGIDVIKTCENAGMPVSLSSREKVRWTGLVLLS